MITSNRRIFLAIFLSLMIFFGIKYIYSNPAFFRPENIYASIAQQTEAIKTKIASIKLPDFSKIFTLNFNPVNNGTPLRPSGYEGQAINFNLPTVAQQNYPSPTYEVKRWPTANSKPTLKPTNIPRPTNVPRPTAVPEIFPIDPSLKRPGSTPDEIFAIAAEKTCVPKEVLRAIAMIESGGHFKTISPRWLSLYNSYNWWNSEFLTEPVQACSGYDYSLNAGVIPDDSKFAGYRCREDNKNGLNVMGPMSVSSYEQSQYADRVANLLGVSKADRRVTLDAVMIAGIIANTNVKPAGCTDWTGHDVIKAACGYYGSCGIKTKVYYCDTFCRNYQSLGGTADCQGADNRTKDNCWQ